jgi:exonuclease SbcC
MRIRVSVQSLRKVRQTLTNKNAELDDARRAANLVVQIAEKVELQLADDELIKQADTILSNARRFRTLSAALPQLDNLWEARGRLAGEDKLVERTNEEITSWKDKLVDLSPQLKQARQNEKTACEALKSAEERLKQAAEREQEPARRLDDLEKVEGLEQQIHEAEERLEPYKPTLGRAEEIEQNHRRYEELSEAVPLMRDVQETRIWFSEAQEKHDGAREEFAKLKAEVDEAGREEAQHQEAVGVAVNEHAEIHENVRKCEHTLSLLNDKLARRNSVTQEEECPVCGSRLDNDEAWARLAQERSHWQEEITKLEDEKETLEDRLKAKEQIRDDAQTAFEEAKETTREAEKVLAAARTDLKHTENAMKRERQAVEDAERKAGNWTDKLDHLTSLEAEAKELSSAPQLSRELAEARLVESRVQGIIVTCRSQVTALPEWSPDERRQLRSDAKDSVAVVSEHQRAKSAAENTFKEAKSHREELETQQRGMKNKLGQAQDKLADLQQRREDAERDLRRQQAKLPPDWKDKPACVDEIALGKLKEESARLRDAEEDETRLREAQGRIDQSDGAIKTLRGQLEDIPAERHRPVEEVQAELSTADEAVRRAEGKLDKAKQLLNTLENQKQTYEERLGARDRAEKEFGYYERLARAFRRNGLQARIVQTAQEAIKVHANTTLERLSNNTWQIELEENNQRTELEILARDLSSPGAPLRQFGYLSGGEKFRVAISLAVAIGHSILGGRTVDTLIIDEGFGALDEVNRSLLVNELHRLSEEVLQGGRVIVVSHQEDVWEEFGSRYRVSKDGDGSTQVEYVGLAESG